MVKYDTFGIFRPAPVALFTLDWLPLAPSSLSGEYASDGRSNCWVLDYC